MTPEEMKTPSTAPTVPGAKSSAKVSPIAATNVTPASTDLPRQNRRMAVAASSAGSTFTVTGQVAKALLALVEAGNKGVTALEVSSWAYRLGAYVHTLRHAFGLVIELEREPHDGGWHGRYMLRSPVEVLEVQP